MIDNSNKMKNQVVVFLQTRLCCHATIDRFLLASNFILNNTHKCIFMSVVVSWLHGSIQNKSLGCRKL